MTLTPVRKYRRPGRHGAKAGAISTKRVAESTNTFWQAMFRVTFGVFVGESVAVGIYVFNTPHGPHRFALTVIATASVLFATVTVLVVPWVARQAWREHFSLAWTLLAGVALTATVWLDGGLGSPLLFMILLPVAYAGMVFRPVASAMCAAIALAELVTIAVTDSAASPQGGRLLIVASVMGGLGVLTWLSSLQRSRVDDRFVALTSDLETLASTDQLTGCLNRRAFNDRLAEEIDRALRKGQPLCLVVADVDDFKQVNDTYGHPAGDVAIQLAGATLRRRVRRSDIVGRIGGDEFAVLLPATAVDDAAALAARVFESYDAGIGRMTFSAGVADLDVNEPTAELLFHEADQSMYRVKRAGGEGSLRRSQGEPIRVPFLTEAARYRR